MESWLEAFARANFSRSSDTAHDLKTPLNVAVLNLELLRMRLRKLSAGADDEKVTAYAQAIENELRRMAKIFDAFFVLSTPPRGDEPPASIDLVPLCLDAAAEAGFPCQSPDVGLRARVHEARIRQAFQLFFEGAAKILTSAGRHAEIGHDTHFRLTAIGAPVAEDFEQSKLFKFYYTDPNGNSDLSLATARLIVETYGGELNAVEESDKVNLRMSVPLGEE
jgi:signal transduction histidine kinase